jgi:hypothetical protein
VEREMDSLQKKQSELTAVWEKERQGVVFIKELKGQIDQVGGRAWLGEGLTRVSWSLCWSLGL